MKRVPLSRTIDLIALTVTCLVLFYLFFYIDTAATAIYTLSLHDALPIWRRGRGYQAIRDKHYRAHPRRRGHSAVRSEEHTSELQSRFDLVCRLLLDKKNGIRDQLAEAPEQLFEAGNVGGMADKLGWALGL